MRTNTTPRFQADLTRQRVPLAHLRYGSDEGTADLVPGMSPVSTPFERPSTPHSVILADEPISPDVDDEERLRYRSWREGKPTLPRSKLKDEEANIHRSKVDKSIEATLPKADLGTTTARSRKTSHYLGLFKGNDVSHDQRRQQKLDEEHQKKILQESSEIRAKVSALSEAAGRGRLKDSATTEDAAELVEHLESEAPRIIPPELLEQIRRHKNLTSGPFKPARRRKSTTSPQQRDSAEYFSHEEKRSPPVAGTDGEESEREQISSAVYFPHRQRTLDKLEPGQDAAESQFPSSRAPDVASKKLPERTHDLGSTGSPDEVQISLEGEDDTEYIHGNLPPPSASRGEFEEQFIHSSDVSMTASETEHDSYDEPFYASSAAEDELAATPTPKSKGLELRSHEKHQRKPLVPIGAVELKPYDHQVGGHSTVYRFSRRAVCKQLNNKENEFYEQVEQSHPELLDFLPRYAILLILTSWRRS